MKICSSSEMFYAECLAVAKSTNVPFAIGGGYAVNFHTGIARYTKDIDIFCKPGDFPRILNKFSELGYGVHVEDERWLAKIKRGDDCVDVIFTLLKVPVMFRSRNVPSAPVGADSLEEMLTLLSFTFRMQDSGTPAMMLCWVAPVAVSPEIVML